MTSAHMLMRDPVLYRILEGPHHRTGDSWHVYPTYDWAHGQCDALEGITHSLCSLEFANHRPLYDWCLDNITAPSRPRQIEFGRLSVSYTITAKRFLKELLAGGHVADWDDPRLPTLRGMRRRGYTPEAIRDFCDRAGGGKVNVTVDMALLESCLREDLNRRCARRMAVLRPLKVVIETLADDEAIDIEAVNNPEDEAAGTRPIRLTREIWIERDDFLEEAPRKYFRLAPDREVRLRWGYCITCREVVKDPASGEVVELRCTHDPETGGGKAPDGRKVKGVIHWVSAADAVDAEVRLYDHLFKVPDPTVSEDGEHWIENLNPESLEVLSGCKLEPSLLETRPGESFQFERLGYFCADSEDHSKGALVFNRTVSLRDSWARKGK